MIPTIAATLFASLALAGGLLHWVAAFRLRRLRPPVTKDRPITPPLTHWRAVKRGVPALAEKLTAMITAGREEDQFLIGVDAGSDDAATAREVRQRFPSRDITIIECDRERAANPKIAKFIQLAPHARHAHWLLTDSEAQLTREFVEGFRTEWAQRGCDALTAGYRFSGLHTLVQAFDVAPALLTLWPGLMLVGRVNFTLGAATGVQAEQLRAVGGWERFSADLAEDRQLGAQLVAHGHEVRLSAHLLTIESDPMPWTAWLKHQHRVAATYRKASPLGALGLPILHTLPLAIAAGIIGPSSWWWVIAVVVWLLRWPAAVQFSRHLQFSLPALPLTLIVVPLLEGLCWLLAWLPLPVWWSGRWRWLK